ncbi:hypothetical protein PFISCL1PPCAC_395 [Pristionchus fissidentatus]|uniref:L-aminoadipate-semialdehyde dehydrogenase-phosphopantetheinyl transferase n=1 Tax=Pristionchus fissidentatus TaxID=1538716 RepID=A0AAV5USF1_9BILA|nr:hypothetical protein PFISCL1PPCAC_395 [Pristionchus fissidentatus]
MVSELEADVPSAGGGREDREEMTPISIRWAVALRETAAGPHFESLFRRAMLALSAGDVNTQRRFHFADDALACVVGRLLTRRAFTRAGVTWDAAPARVVRDPRGKPRDPNAQLKFNVSHQGDLVVLAATTDPTVIDIGVDVMRTDQDKEEAATRIDRLKNAFTLHEQRTMLAKNDEADRWRCFYRHWCLKEAVLKSTGKGITEDLRKLEFHLSEEIGQDTVIYSTEYHQDGEIQPDFIFEESNIGADHATAVGKIVTRAYDRRPIDPPPLFELVDLPYLLEPSTNQCEDVNDANEFDIFMAKPWKPVI